VSNDEKQEVVQQPNNKRRRAVDDSQPQDDLLALESKLSLKRNLVILLGGKAKEDKYQKIISKLGSRHIEDLNEHFDVYVTDEKLVRNSKLLLSIASGASVVGVKWLEDSQKRGKLITDDIVPYLIIDKQFEKQYGCSLQKLFLENKSSQLLSGKKVYVSPNVVGISKPQMNQLIEAIGGDLSENMKGSDICIFDQDKDKKSIAELKKNKKNQP